MRTDNNIWINPVTVIRLFTNYLTSKARALEEITKLVKDRDFRPTVEAWCAAMYLLALDKREPEVRHFLQQNLQDPPDFYGLDLFLESDLAHGYIREIEVFEYVPESILSLGDEIRKKVRKAYSKKTVLVCHIRKNFADTVGHIHEIVAPLQSKNEIWIIGGSERTRESPHLVAQVFPNMEAFHVDIEDIFKMPTQPAFIQGSMGKSKDIFFEHTGKTLLLTPKFEVKE